MARKKKSFYNFIAAEEAARHANGHTPIKNFMFTKKDLADKQTKIDRFPCTVQDRERIYVRKKVKEGLWAKVQRRREAGHWLIKGGQHLSNRMGQDGQVTRPGFMCPVNSVYI